MSKQQTSYNVKETKPIEYFFETHQCHFYNEKFKNVYFGFTMSIYMPIRMSTCDNKNSRIIQLIVRKFYTFTEIWLKILILVEM
jgi:hypothetical protein